jgi:hypothetical protein
MDDCSMIFLRVYVLQESHEHQLEKDHRVYAFLTFAAEQSLVSGRKYTKSRIPSAFCKNCLMECAWKGERFFFT